MSQEQEKNKKTQTLAIDLNKNGLGYLNNLQPSSAFSSFKKAQKMLLFQSKLDPTNSQFHQLLAVTFNNIAIYYKKVNKPKSALSYLTKALDIQDRELGDWKAVATTHLNIAAIYSHVLKHEEAIDHILMGEKMIQKYKAESQKNGKMKQNDKAYNYVKLVSSYNLGVQYENLKKYEESLEKYKNAKTLAQTKNKSLQAQSEEGIKRVEEAVTKRRKKLVELIQKKRQIEERGNYESMRNNKKHFKPIRQTGDSGSLLELKRKRYNVYFESRRDAVSLDRFKKLEPIIHKTEGREEEQRRKSERKSDR